MANKVLWGADLYKGFKLENNNLLGGVDINDVLPFQMLTLEEKTIDWIKAVADFYDVAGWNNVEKKAGRIQKNYWMRAGKLDQSDYIINPEINPLSGAIGMLVPQEHQSPLQQFYPLAPNFVDVLRGEFIKRDNTWTIEAIDQFSRSQMFEAKEKEFENIIMQQAMLEKQQALAEMGLTEEVDPEQYQQQMQSVQKQLTDLEFKYKDFRTTGVEWAEKVLKIHEKRYNLHELEPDGFESGLISDSEFWHIDLLDDDFKMELLNPMYCDYHKGPNVKYVSDGDYFLWFDFMSAGDIVNKFGRRMKEEDILKLKEVFFQTANLIVPDYLKAHQGAYYDLSKPWAEATDLNPAMNDTMLGKELAYNYMRSPNFDHNIEPDIFGANPLKNNGHPQMFRVMRLYWRSFMRIGWLTKINRDGTVEEPTWIDENYKVTVEPVYDTSVNKEKTKDNLIYGEHIDWTWTTQWRHVIKMAANMRHTHWMDNKNRFNSIYIDGGPVKFQFKGRSNPFDSLPPVEGCTFSYINTDAHSLIDRLRSSQIIYNICMNKVPKKFLGDRGNKIAIDTRIMTTNTASNTTDTLDQMQAYSDLLDDGDILPYRLSREALEGLGQPALPQVLQLSTVQEAQMYFQLGQQIKMEAGEIIGISRNRLGQNKASDTAYGVQQGITYSETQTEKYYEQHSNLMQRVRQRMLDAAQYYTTISDSAKDYYMNDRNENVFLDIEGMENMLPHYNINLQSRANVRAALQTISQFLIQDNTTGMKPSAKVEAIVENSIPKILSVIRKSELEQEQAEAAKQQQEMEMRQKEIEAENERTKAEMARLDEKERLDRESNERVATIRALGGMQTDNNANGQTDSKDNLGNLLKQQEMTDKKKMAQDTINANRQTKMDELAVEREKAQLDLKKEKIRQEGLLKVAKENKPPRG